MTDKTHCNGACAALGHSKSLRRSGVTRPRLFGTAQPRKLGVQKVDGGGGGFACFHALTNGCRCWRAKGAASSLVATVGSAAASTQAAELLWRFVEQNVGVLSHGVLPTPHSLARVGKQSKWKGCC